MDKENNKNIMNYRNNLSSKSPTNVRMVGGFLISAAVVSVFMA